MTLGAGGQQFLRQFVLVGVQAGRVGAQRDHAGAGQGGDIDYHPGLETPGIGERVAQYQAALGIGVEYLDGFAGHAGDHVARFGGTAAGHVFSGGHDTHHVDRQLQLGDRAQRAKHAGGTAHVEFHLVHLGARLDGNAAAVEGDALADQHIGLLAGFAALVVHDHQLGRLVAAGGHRQQRAHAQLFHFLFFQHADTELGLLAPQLARMLRQVGRGADIAGQVGQLAGLVDAPTHGGALVQRFPRRCAAQAARLYDQAGQFGSRLGLGQRLCVAIGGAGEVARQPGQQPAAVAVLQFQVGAVQDGLAGLAVGQRLADSLAQFTGSGAVELALVTTAYQQQALVAGDTGQHAALARFAGKITQADRRGHGAGGGLVQLPGRDRKRFFTEYRQDGALGPGLGGILDFASAEAEFGHNGFLAECKLPSV